MVHIRYLTPTDDKMAISQIYEKSWKYAYRGIIPQEYLDAIPKGCWVSNLNNPNRKTLICIDNEKMIGTSSFGKARLKQFDDWGEIFSIYLLPEYMKQGYGKFLMETVVLELKKLGYKNIYLWCLEENVKARHFYERFGFVLSDDYLDDNIGGKNLREFRYIYKM